jgi:L-rhamnose isomerase
MTSPPPSLYDKALIIQGFVVSGVWKNLPAHTSAHTLDEAWIFDQRPIFRMLNRHCTPAVPI